MGKFPGSPLIDQGPDCLIPIASTNAWLQQLSAKGVPEHKGGHELKLHLLPVVLQELLESRVRTQRSKIWAGVNGGKITVPEGEGPLQRSQSFLFVTFRGVGSA
jgi:hypothetical protein